jgi:hypothetical protein
MSKSEQKSYWENAYPGGAALAERFAATLQQPAYGQAVRDAKGKPIPGYESVLWGGDYARYLPSNIMAVYTPLALSEATANGFVWTGAPDAKDGTRLKAARMAGKVSAAYPDLGQAHFRAALSRIPLAIKGADGAVRTVQGISVSQLIQLLDGMRDIAVTTSRRYAIGQAGQKAIGFILNLAKFADTPEIRAIADTTQRMGVAAYTAEEGLAVAFGGTTAE